jgi:hypothetical protein
MNDSIDVTENKNVTVMRDITITHNHYQNIERNVSNKDEFLADLPQQLADKELSLWINRKDLIMLPSILLALLTIVGIFTMAITLVLSLLVDLKETSEWISISEKLSHRELPSLL